MPDIFATFTQAPSVVEPRRFTCAEDHRPYGRPQRADEVADWLAVDGKVLAPTTAETRRWSHGARWMYWDAGTPFLKHHRFSVTFALRLSDIVERNQNRVDTAHLIMVFERELAEVLRTGTSDQLDHVSEWLRFPYSTDATGLPGVLVNEAEETLANPDRHAPGRIGPLSPVQWREGMSFNLNPDSMGRAGSLMDRTRTMLRREVRRRLEAVGEANLPPRRPQRL